MKKTSKFLGSALAVTGVVAGSAATAAAQTAITFKIPAGTIDSMVSEFQRLTGLKVIISEPEIGKLQSPGVAGTMTAEKALDALLAGLRVRATFGPKTVTLDLSKVEYQVNVTGETMLASPKYSQPLRDTPQTVAVIPQQLFNQQNATTLREVLRNTPGITMSIGEGGSGGTSSGDNVLVRGFSARNDIYVDGARDVGLVSRDGFNLESVEVAKGPASVTAGRGATGGSINLVSKRASLFNASTLRLTGGTADNKRGSFDVNHAISKTAAFRLNGMWQDSGYAGRDVAKYKGWGIAPALTLGIGTPTQIILNYERMQQDNIPDWGIPTLLPDVAIANHVTVNDLNWSNFYGIASRDYEKTTSDLATATIDHKFNAFTHLRNLTRYGRNYRDAVLTPPRPATSTAGQGPTDPGYNALVAQIRRTDTKFQHRNDQNVTNQTDLTRAWQTGQFHHNVALGLELIHEYQPAYAFAETFANGRPPVDDLFNPTPYVAYTPVYARTGATTDAHANTAAVYFFDNVQAGKFTLDFGVRQDHVKADYTNVTAAPALVKTTFAHTDDQTTGRVALVFKPQASSTLYAAYSTAFYPSFDGTLGITMAATGVNSSTLQPERMRNIEGGAKWEHGLLLVTAALFNAEKVNTRTVDLAGNQVLGGDQRVRGAEFNVTGNITSRWGIFSGISFMHGTVISSGVPVEVGSELAYVPHISFNAFTTYRFQNRLTIGGGVNGESGHFHNQTGGFLFVSGATSQPKYVENAETIQSYTRFWTANAMASYPVSKHITLQVNVNNITNTKYADRSYDRHFLPGATRQLLVSPVFSW